MSEIASNFRSVTFGTRRLMVFIDGGYVRNKITSFFEKNIIKYQSFVDNLIDDLSLENFLFEIIRIYYYDALPDEEDADFESRSTYLKIIRSLPRFEDRLGTLKKAKKDKRRQKSVDTLLAIDMLSKAYMDHYDIAILIAGDEDFLPVVDAVKSTGKRVFGAFFEKSFTEDFKDTFDNYIVIDKDWFNGKYLLMDTESTQSK